MIYSQVLVSLEVLRWPLRVTVSRSEGVTVLTLRGRVAQESAVQLSGTIGEALAAGDRRLVVDFEGVDYISSAGLVALEGVAIRLREAGGAMILSGIDGPVRTTFQLAAVIDRFAIEASSDDAVRRLAGATFAQGQDAPFSTHAPTK
jgi:anti-sigma B factor antagonist